MEGRQRRRIDRPRYSFGTGTFLSEDVAACEDGYLADQIALAQGTWYAESRVCFWPACCSWG